MKFGVLTLLKTLEIDLGHFCKALGLKSTTNKIQRLSKINTNK